MRPLTEPQRQRPSLSTRTKPRSLVKTLPIGRGLTWAFSPVSSERTIGLSNVDGFANWGNPGSVSDYDKGGFGGGMLLGKRFDIAGARLRIEVDGTFGDLSAKTNQLDPEGLDETARSEFRWIATGRGGGEQAIGSATVFATGGLALANVVNSVTDIDFSPDTGMQMDPDDSFRDRSTKLGLGGRGRFRSAAGR